MALPTTSHDALFRALVANSGRAGALFAGTPPGEMVASIDFGHLPELREGSFVDGGYENPMRCLVPGSFERRQDNRIFLLLEHKSHVAPGTPL